VSGAAAEREDAERRLGVSRAETAALHATLAGYKTLVEERDAEIREEEEGVLPEIDEV
jgi:hypothetical protein